MENRRFEMKVLAVTLLLLLVSSPVLFGQTRSFSVPVTGPNDTASPMTASGEVRFNEESSADGVKIKWDEEILLRNVATKPIVAYEVLVEGAGVHHVAQADYFFRQDLPFVPGATDTVSVKMSHTIETTSKLAEHVPNGTLKVIFVEFADGSEYGRSNWGNTLSDTRRWTIRKFQEVLSLFRQSGEDGFRTALEKELARPDTPRLTAAGLNEIREILDAKGADAAVARIEERLTAAQERSSLLTRSLDPPE
jgi:hypothetical protein